MNLVLDRWLPVVALCVAFGMAWLLSDYQRAVASYIGIFAIVCVGLVLMTGVAGMVSFGQAAFVGLGAYATAYLTTAYQFSPWVGLLFALVGVAVVATLIGLMTVRMSGHYLALVTLCFCISFYFLVGNLEMLGRFNGLTGIPSITLFGYDLRSEFAGYLVVLVALALSTWWVRRILNSRVGRVIRSLRTGSLIAETFGASAYRHRLIAFVVAAVLSALSGWLYAHLQRFLNPTPFGVQMSLEYLFMTVIGGSASVWGAVLGAGLVTLLKQELQSLLQPLFGATTRLEMLVFAAVIVVVLIKARRGLWPFIAHFLPPSGSHQTIVAETLADRRQKPNRGVVLLAADQLTRNFGGLVAVDRVSFEVRAGEILGLLGPNGAGKSTLFNLLTGVIEQTAGQIRLLGRPQPHVSSRAMCRSGVARTFQHVKLVSDMTLIENVAIGATHLGHAGLAAATLRLDRAEERRLLSWSMQLLEQVGLADKAWEMAGSLPLGHQRILEIARALAADPVLLLLDEPAAGLRANEKAELAQLLCRLRDDGLGVLLVEHDMEFVSIVADRLMVMNFGKLIAYGAPAEVRADRAVQEAYLGVAA